MVAPPGQNTKVQPIKPGEKGLKCENRQCPLYGVPSTVVSITNVCHAVLRYMVYKTLINNTTGL